MLRVATLVAALAVAHATPAFRKSLSFGPVLPHARFESQPITTFAAAPDCCPFAAARSFLSELGHRDAATAGGDESAYFIREDSYTDKNTGVTHIYARQVINGIEVADGNINLNIKGGRVLSYGDSFYHGDLSHEALNLEPLHEQGQYGYCAELAQQVYAAGPQAQVIFAEPDGAIHPPLAVIHNHNCGQVSAVKLLGGCGGLPDGDARYAALSFMMHATPSLATSEAIRHNIDGLAENITSTFRHSFAPGASHDPMVNMLEGVPDAVNPVKARIAFVQTPDGAGSRLNLVWKLEVEMADNWYDAAVSAIDPSVIISVNDWVSDSPYYAPTPKKPTENTYNVFPWGVNDPSVGDRDLLADKVDSLASPLGWHSIPLANDPNYPSVTKPDSTIVNYTTTFGNNIFAQENWAGGSGWLDNFRPVSSTKWPVLTFDYPYKPKKADDALAEAQSWINATVTQLFYTGNMIHDLYYRYGFDEISGNFQQHNFGRGGGENDGVIANAQDGSGFNNANFATPPDGQNGRCRMYLWNTATPYRDGDLEAGIVIHELSHGMSTRLTGGPRDSSCLGFGEAGGMGEGWGDFLATVIRSNKTYSDYAMGAWAANQEKGIRNYVYSLNFTINPTTYKTLDKPGYWGVHAIGEVWAEMLWVIAQNLIAKHGYSDSLFPPQPLPDGTIPEGDFYHVRALNASGAPEGALVPIHGNSLAVQLVLNGMKLQPCRPGFFEARDAIIQADELLTGGENLCEIWEGFSQRGLGPDATVIGRTPWGGGVRKDDYELPQACRQPIPEPEPEEPEPEEPEPEEPEPEEPEPEDPEPEDPEPKEPGKDKRKKGGKAFLDGVVLFGYW